MTPRGVGVQSNVCNTVIAWRKRSPPPAHTARCLADLDRVGVEACTSSKPDAQEASFDPLRDGPLRYCGYANECGEAFSAWLPAYGVPLSYAVAIAYVLVDTVDKSVRAYKRAKQTLASHESDIAVNSSQLTTLLTAERAVDTLVWQMLASVVCPGATIHVIVLAMAQLTDSGLHLNDLSAMPSGLNAFITSAAAAGNVDTAEAVSFLSRSIPTATGLAAIPFIVHPIDNAVHALLDFSLRPRLKAAICDGARGKDVDLDICIVDD